VIPVLELEAVTCRYSDGRRTVTALDDVSLAVMAGELVAVMGPSGSGKSTLVHVSCGLVRPLRGAVRLGGKSAPFPGRRWWAERRRREVGVVHQRLNLVPGLGPLENVALPLELDGWRTSDARAAARHALAEAGAADLAGLRTLELSVGEQQRVAVARAIVGDRPLALADEPTAALDTVGAEVVVQRLADLAHAGRAVVLLTHDSRLASWADRVVVLRDGRIVDSVGAQPADARPATAGEHRPPAAWPTAIG
jgi:putative ABC transport system ATP-binding protein